MSGENTTRWWKWAIAGTVVLGLGFGGGVAFADNYMRPADPDNPIAVRGCVIRFDTLSDSGASVVPRIHANSAHMCVGVTSVRADWNDGALVLNDSNSKGSIVSMSVSPDETLTRKGIRCGGSGGGKVSRVYCYDQSGNFVPAHSKKLYGSLSNLWVTWHMWHH
ncbi:MAG: hypothetical protein ACRDTM_10660 [Micromonosporaceae bacterium]